MAVPMATSASFSRPANTTQYASGDLIANDTTAGSVVAMEFAGGPTVIRRARLTKDDDDVTAATFRLHLFTGDPTASAPANGDNGAISLNTAIAEYIGSFDFDMTASPDIYNTAGNVALGVPLKGNEVMSPWAGTIYGLLEARGTYTPASGETFTVDLEYLAGS
jgi:hypothetical protein